MPKGPKFKKGFTWRHHFDEWWDRRPQEWKVRLFVGVVLGGAAVAVGLLLWGNRWMERDELLVQAKRNHQNRIEGTDKLMTPKVDPPEAPSLRNPVQLEPRASE
jgi:hypothetical protein